MVAVVWAFVEIPIKSVPTIAPGNSSVVSGVGKGGAMTLAELERVLERSAVGVASPFVMSVSTLVAAADISTVIVGVGPAFDSADVVECMSNPASDLNSN